VAISSTSAVSNASIDVAAVVSSLMTAEQKPLDAINKKIASKELAEASGVAFSTLMRLETGEGVPAAQAKTLDAIQKAFEKAGIEFIGTPESGAGIRWKT